MDKKDRNRVAILHAIRHCTGPVTSRDLARALADAGLPLSERTVRLYLGQLDAEGLTEPHGRQGRVITAAGLAELRAAQAYERVGYLSAEIDQMTFAMNFDLHTCSGQVVVNTSLVSPRHLHLCLDKVRRVFAKGYAMGTLVALLPPGQQVGELLIPPDKIGLCTVCSITLNGVLLKHGVPTVSRFGGLLELRDGQATRFVEMIHYDATSLDPLVIFIRSGMTNYLGAIRDGNGLIGASFREMPGNARELIVHLAERLKAIGLGAFAQIGLPGQPVLGMPVPERRLGSVVIGGLNPVAILEESGYRTTSRALSGLMEYNRLFNFEELPKALKAFL